MGFNGTDYLFEFSLLKHLSHQLISVKCIREMQERKNVAGVHQE